MITWKEKQGVKAKTICAKVDYPAEEVSYDNSRLEMLNKHIQSMIERKVIWSGSYCLAKYEDVFADCALGYMEDGRSFRPDTFYELQSITKVITAIAILKLVEDGMIYLSQPIGDILSEFSSEPFDKITMLHLLTHTSGLIPSEGTFPKNDYDWEKFVDVNDVAGTWIEAVAKCGLRTEPGKEWAYSAIGFVLLGEIITRVSGMRAEKYIKETILIPCEMHETHWRHEAMSEWEKRYSTDLLKNNNLYAMKWKEIPETAGGLISTSRELIHFGQMILGGGEYRRKRVIGRKALESLFVNFVDKSVKDYCWGHQGWWPIYGAGVPILEQDNDQQQLVSSGTIFHEGYGCCIIMIDKEEDFVAVWNTVLVEKDKWCPEAVKNTASVIWSGLR